MIEGESGCGKTKILRVLADMCDKREEDLVTIHIGEQLDSKVCIPLGYIAPHCILYRKYQE